MPRIDGWIDSDNATFTLDEDSETVALFMLDAEPVWSCTPDDAREIAAALTKWAKGK